jgi:hypothetical protein
MDYLVFTWTKLKTSFGQKRDMRNNEIQQPRFSDATTEEMEIAPSTNLILTLELDISFTQLSSI